MEFFNPVHSMMGQGMLARLGRAMRTVGISGEKILLVTRGGDFFASNGYQILRESLQEYEVREIAFAKSNPDITDLFGVLEELRFVKFDLVIAVGGGSVLDIGKCIATLQPMEISDVSRLRNCIAQGIYEGETVPWIGIPTTSGTGSEVTPWATVWDKATGGKLSLHNPKNFARIAIVDPVLTKSLPLGLTVASALDAVCHATESYWARHTNEVSQAFALLAIRRITDCLEALLEKPEDEQLREEIGKGSLYAGLAFSNTKTTICHSVSYPLTSQFGIPHGIAAALSLAEFMKLNEPALQGKEVLLEAFGCRSMEEVKEWIQRMMKRGGYGNKLRDYGIKPSDFPQIMQHAFTKGRADNNPVVVTETMALDVLKNLY